MKSDREISGTLQLEIDNAQNGKGSRMSSLWRRALDAYHGEPTGTELVGQSQAVSLDVADAITWLLPELIRVFTDERVCTVAGMDPQTAQLEDQIGQALNWHFYDAVEGRSVMFLQSFIQDAMLQMNGVSKVWWEESTDIERQVLENPTQDDLIVALNQPGVTVSEVDENGQPLMDGDESEDYDTPDNGARYVAIETRTTKRTLKYSAVAPEEFLISSDASSLEIGQAKFCAHYRPMMVTDIIEQFGVTKEFADALADADWVTGNQVGGDDIISTRDRLGIKTASLGGDSSNADDSTEYKEVYECYLLVDMDGDGMAERWQFFKSGSHILERQPWPMEPPFSSASPFPEPHMFYGLSVYDKLREVQAAKTALMRQLEDNNALVNNPQRIVLDGVVNRSDLKTRRPASFIRTKQLDAVRDLPVQQFGAETYASIDYHDRLIQRRVGVSPGNASELMPVGGDTAHGLERLMSAKEEVQWMIAKMMGETGIRCLFRNLYNALRDSGEPFLVRNGDEWTQINPQQWPKDITITIRSAAGMGARMRDAQALGQVIQYQSGLLDRGLGGVMVTETGIYRAIEDWQKAVGLQLTRDYFQDPDSDPAKQAAQAKQQQSQVEQQKMEQQQRGVMDMAQAKINLERLKQQQAGAKDRADIAMNLEQMIQDQEAKLTELELKYGTDIPGALT